MSMTIDPAALRPIITEVVRQTLDQRSDTGLPPERLAFPEGEASILMGIPKHVLRDARLRGELTGRLVGKRIVYDRRELLRFLSAKS